MTRFLKGAGGAVAALALVGAAAGPAQAAGCGSSGSGLNQGIKASGVGCGTAKAVSAAWAKRILRDQGRSHSIKGFACRNSGIPTGPEAPPVKVRCSRGSASISWVTSP